MNQHSFPCPHCGGADIRRSRRQSFLEYARMLVGTYPFRCLQCGERFFGNVWMLQNDGCVNCPRCLRLDVQSSSRRELRLRLWDRMLMALGAHLYRCVPCRHHFFSFRRLVDAGDGEVVRERGSTV